MSNQPTTTLNESLLNVKDEPQDQDMAQLYKRNAHRFEQCVR